jgi:hypothetical protein
MKTIKESKVNNKKNINQINNKKQTSEGAATRLPPCELMKQRKKNKSDVCRCHPLIELNFF